jgi:hypothetical protein
MMVDLSVFYSEAQRGDTHRAIKLLRADAERPEDRPFPDVIARAELLARVVALCGETQGPSR